MKWRLSITNLSFLRGTLKFLVTEHEEQVIKFTIHEK